MRLISIASNPHGDTMAKPKSRAAKTIADNIRSRLASYFVAGT